MTSGNGICSSRSICSHGGNGTRDNGSCGDCTATDRSFIAGLLAVEIVAKLLPVPALKVVVRVPVAPMAAVALFRVVLAVLMLRAVEAAAAVIGSIHIIRNSKSRSGTEAGDRR